MYAVFLFNDLSSTNDFYFRNILQIDLKKMPLGKLSKKQLEQAYSVLSEAQQVSFTIYLYFLIQNCII